MIKRFFKAVPHALRGIRFTVKNEPNFVVELFCATFVVIALIFLKGSQLDFILVLITISIVLVAELFNTAIEKLVDLIKMEKNYLAGIIKDVSAGFVLTSIIFSFFIGILIFYPLISKRFF